MEADIDTKTHRMILRIPPTGVYDLVRIGRGIDGAVRDAEVDSIMTVIVNPIAQSIGPVSARASIADPRMRWRCSGGRRGGTVFVRHISAVDYDSIVKRIVGAGVIEDRFLGGGARVGRI